LFFIELNSNLYLYRAQSKIEEACDLYQRAGNAFKMAKKWSG